MVQAKNTQALTIKKSQEMKKFFSRRVLLETYSEVVRKIVFCCVKVKYLRLIFTLVNKEFVECVLERRVAGVDLAFACPNNTIFNLVNSIESKEPETIKWLNGIEPGSTLWDVGANIGIYSIYAAKIRGCDVVAFEPSVFNLEFLARNINLNGVNDRIALIPCALSDGLKISDFTMTSTEWGGALSSLDSNRGWDGRPFTGVFSYKSPSFSLDYFFESYKLKQPDYLKIDVDGIEHLILRGGEKTLAQVKGLIIEINDSYFEQSHNCEDLLEALGFVLIEKSHNEDIYVNEFSTVYNQIWRKLSS